MGWKFAAMSRYRPRVLTLVVLFAVAAPVALANLTFDEGANGHILHRSFGWPLIWHRYLSASWGWGYRTVGWYYSAARLAGNLAMWTAMLALPAGTCEWLLRRYRPQPRWSLRTMLVAVALAATLCGWFTRAHSRAKLNDEIIAALPPRGPGAYGTVLDRAGPKWLDLLGVDRYRREIVLAEPGRPFHGDNREDEKLLYRLAQLPRLQYLHLVVDRFTPAMADALNGMNALRRLKVEHAWYEYEDDVSFSRARLPPIGGMTELTKLELVDVTIDEESVAGLSKLKQLSIDSNGVYPKNKTRDVWRGSLITVGKMPQLERLDLRGMTIKNNGLASLAGLANLKTLSLHYVRTNGPPLFERLPPLPRLEVLELESASITDRDLVQLAALPHLKSLSVSDARATAAGLAELAPLEYLEELSLNGDKTTAADSYVSSAGLRSLRILTRLKTLHLRRDRLRPPHPKYAPFRLDDGDELPVPEDDLASFRLAIAALRKGKPGIVIDGDTYAIRSRGKTNYGPSFSDDIFHYGKATWLPESGVGWMTPSERAEFATKGGWARFDGAGWKGDAASF